MKTSTLSNRLRLLLIGSSVLASVFAGSGVSHSASLSATVLQQPAVCTTQLGRTILVKLKNNTAAKVNANAISTDCQESTREQLEAGWEVTAITQVGQVWSFRDADTNQLIGTVTLTEQNAYASIIVGTSVEIVAAANIDAQTASAGVAL